MSILMFLGVALLLLAGLGTVHADGEQTALDGHIYDLNFDATTTTYTYKYNPIDSKAMLSVMVYPDNSNKGTVVSKVSASVPCSRFVDEHTDFFTGTYKVHNELEDGDLYDFDLTECTVYVTVSSTTGAKAKLAIISSIPLVNNYVFTLTDSDETDTYDYEAHNYLRYFMAMLCDKPTDAKIHPTVSITSPGSKAQIYVNGWGPSGVDEPGRPNSDTKGCTSHSRCNIDTLNDALIPGWVFVAVDVSEVFNAEPTEDDPDPQHTASISFDLEIPVQVTPDDYLDLNLGMYAGCSKLVYFRPSDWATIDDDGDVVPFSLLFEVMTRENFSHDHTGLFYLRIGKEYPLTAENQIHGISDNIMSMTETDVNYYMEDGGYISISMVKGLEFPQPPSIGEVININATMLKDSNTLSVGRRAITETLKRTTGNEGCGVEVDYARIAFDTVGINKLEYAHEEDALLYDRILCDYVIATKTQSANVTPKLHMGLYIGAAGACIPYRLDPTDEKDPDTITTDYLIESHTIEANLSPENTVDITYIIVPKSSSQYFQDGAYILDIYNTNLDQSEDPKDISVSLTAQPSWNLRRSVQYTLDLDGTAIYDFFVLTLNDLSKGMSFSIEPEMSASKVIAFNVYASFKHKTPDANSRFTTTGYGRADLFISADDLKELEEEDEYKIYIAVDTSFRGYVIVYYTEGNEIQYNMSDGDNVIVPLTTEKPSAGINMHSSKYFQAKEMIFYFDASDNDLSDGSIIKACVASTIIDQISECPRGNEVQMKVNAEKKIYKITLSDTETEHSDHFVFIVGIFGSVNKSLNLRVFAEKNTSLEIGESTAIISPEISIPLLAHLNTRTNKDYIMEFNIPNAGTANARYTVRVCAEYPSYSNINPPDIDANNSRNCLTEKLSAGFTLMFDLIGDSLYNESTVVDDLYFIRSTSKYVSIYPDNGLPFAEIDVVVYEDEHTSTDEDDKTLKGTPGETTYFRLHVLSADSLSDKDMLNFRFNGDNPVDYCISSTPHVEMNKDNCIKSHISKDQSEYVSNIDEIVRMTDIDPSYDAKHDAYIYFSFNMPLASEDNRMSVYTTFSNILIHYIDQIKSTSDDIEKKSHFFELYKGRVMAFYTVDVTLNTPFRFYVIPDVVKNDQDHVSSAYTTSVIGVKKTTTIASSLPEPTATDNDASRAGILFKDYTITEADLVDGKNYVIVVVKFVNDNPTMGLYKAGFLGASDENSHVLSDLVYLDSYHPYHLSSADSTSTKTDGKLSSTMLYAPYGSSRFVYSVMPCAGLPGIYQSYLNPLPKYAGAFVDTYPGVGYTMGKPFKGEFLDRDENQINVYTGFVLNATAYVPSISDDPEVLNNLRWDAYINVIASDDLSLTGGPIIPDANIKLSENKGSQLTITVPVAQHRYNSSLTEYTVYAIPAVSSEHVVPYYDAAPDSYCGMMSFGFPLLVDESNKKDAQWYSYTPDNEDPNKIVSMIELKTNYNPKNHKYDDNIKPNFYDLESDGSLSSEDKKKLRNLYNVNVVVREVTVSPEGVREIIGYSAYNHIQLEITGDIPVTKNGLFGWEIALIIIAVIVVFALIVFLVVWIILQKRKSMEYRDVDGQGGYKNEEALEITG